MSAISAFPESQIQRILEARHHDPFEILGRHKMGKDDVVCVFQPRAREVKLAGKYVMRRYGDTDLFLWRGDGKGLPCPYTIHWVDDTGNRHQRIDPYCFAPQISDFDMHLFAEGTHLHAYRFLGANPRTVDGIDGVLFATWAPNAQRVSVVGDFNHWDGRCHPMRVRGGSGIWELFLPGVGEGAHYKLEIRDQHGHLHLKADPYGRAFELRPGTAGLITPDSDYVWHDTNWRDHRENLDWLHAPMSIYELHPGSWQRDDNGEFLDYRTLAHRLVGHARHLGFTHIQLLPITEHPLDASWGYQTTGYFAPTSRFGSPDDFRYFVDHCHQHGIGVLMDWVPAHFPKDAHGLARFDGSALYEHEDPRKGEHQDWGTLIYNYGRNEVKSFLLSSAIYWLEEFHIDGLRVDAVASMLYLDYSRDEGEWLPNIYGGNENLEAIDFIRQMNTVIHEHHPGCLTIAEESTSWPQVSRPTWLGGLGFSMKWNMGWMHDTLTYFSKDPIHRHYHHQQLTFGLLYAFTENFVLPFSHDEVVHGKGSLLGKMPGDEWQKFANLRLLYTYMYTYPGKKLLFMGCEFGQGREWNFDASLDWYVLDYPLHRGVMDLLKDLNHLHREQPPLHQYDFDNQGFEWIDCNDAAQSTISYLRKSDDRLVVVVLNFTPVVRENYRIGLPAGGQWRELLNSDSEFYGGSNTGNGSPIIAEEQAWMNRPYSVELTLPPLGALILTPA
ncbi:MAG TPA: 1,4-alpha-glucan branching protein GlgB [Gammaproteobacteria bacterium]|nr:1,4-alpha-glucan branching protein GlgB [Gammaproteobacteria bacterium]